MRLARAGVRSASGSRGDTYRREWQRLADPTVAGDRLDSRGTRRAPPAARLRRRRTPRPPSASERSTDPRRSPIGGSRSGRKSARRDGPRLHACGGGVVGADRAPPVRSTRDRQGARVWRFRRRDGPSPSTDGSSRAAARAHNMPICGSFSTLSGGGGIRTLDGPNRQITVFETAAVTRTPTPSVRRTLGHRRLSS